MRRAESLANIGHYAFDVDGGNLAVSAGASTPNGRFDAFMDVMNHLGFYWLLVNQAVK